MRIVARRCPKREAAEARRLLAESDWRIIRAMEAELLRRGADLPADVIAARQAARERLNKD